MTTQLQLGDISVDVVFKDIKNVHLSVYPPTGRVRISAPTRMSLDTVRIFAVSKLGWIKQQQSKLHQQQRETPREFLDRESHYLWGRRYLLDIKEGVRSSNVSLAHRKIVLSVSDGASIEKRKELLDDFYRKEIKKQAQNIVEIWEVRLGVRVSRTFVQKMRTKWGSCNPAAKNIRLNLELAKKPLDCLEYIILHEMLHFFVPNHGERFVTLMDRNMPSWRLVRQKLNEAPLAHLDWAY